MSLLTEDALQGWLFACVIISDCDVKGDMLASTECLLPIVLGALPFDNVRDARNVGDVRADERAAACAWRPGVALASSPGLRAC